MKKKALEAAGFVSLSGFVGLVFAGGLAHAASLYAAGCVAGVLSAVFMQLAEKAGRIESSTPQPAEPQQ